MVFISSNPIIQHCSTVRLLMVKPYLHVPSSNKALVLSVTDLKEFLTLLQHSTTVTQLQRTSTNTGLAFCVLSSKPGCPTHLRVTGATESCHCVLVCNRYASVCEIPGLLPYMN